MHVQCGSGGPGEPEPTKWEAVHVICLVFCREHCSQPRPPNLVHRPTPKGKSKTPNSVVECAAIYVNNACICIESPWEADIQIITVIASGGGVDK